MKQQKLIFDNEKIQVSIQLNPDFVSKITKTAKSLGMSRSSYMRYLINLGFAKLEKTRELVVRYRLDD